MFKLSHFYHVRVRTNAEQEKENPVGSDPLVLQSLKGPVLLENLIYLCLTRNLKTIQWSCWSSWKPSSSGRLPVQPEQDSLLVLQGSDPLMFANTETRLTVQDPSGTLSSVVGEAMRGAWERRAWGQVWTRPDGNLLC